MFNPVLPNWERDVQFNVDQELDNVRVKPTWVKLGKRNPSLAAQRELADIELRDPAHFASGQLHDSAIHWNSILKNSKSDQSTLVSNWLKNGVDILPSFCRFKGNVKGQSFDLDKPPKQYFQNSRYCKNFVLFIKSQLLEKVKYGSLHVFGKLGQCELPIIVMPLTIERSNPRLCHDERYLNLWIKDNPFHLETLKHAHRPIQSKDKMLQSINVLCANRNGTTKDFFLFFVFGWISLNNSFFNKVIRKEI